MFGTQSLTPAPKTEPTSFPLLASHAGAAVPAGREAFDAGSREFWFYPVPAGTCRGKKLFGLTLTSPGPSPMVPLSVFPLCSAPSSLLGTSLVPRPEQLLPGPPQLPSLLICALVRCLGTLHYPHPQSQHPLGLP